MAIQQYCKYLILCQCQENELHQTAKLIKESTTLATEESTKYKATKEVIRSLTAQVTFDGLNMGHPNSDWDYYIEFVLSIFLYIFLRPCWAITI